MNSIGQQVRAVKSDGGDIKAVLAELGAAKKTLEGLVRPQMEAATAAGNTELREALMPAFEKVMTKGERKKRAKELKARDAAAAGGGSAKAAAAADKGGKKGDKKAGKNSTSCAGMVCSSIPGIRRGVQIVYTRHDPLPYGFLCKFLHVYLLPLLLPPISFLFLGFCNTSSIG